MQSRVKIFISYAQEDAGAFITLDKFLFDLKQSDKIEIWDAGKILAGGRSDESIQELQNADLILLMVSIDFLNAPGILENEIPIITRRYKNEGATVIPIIVRSTDLRSTPFKDIKKLPLDDRPVDLHDNEDEAYKGIADNIKSVVEEILEKKSFKARTFASETKTDKPRVFLSIGTPHTAMQADYVDLWKAKLNKAGFQLVTLPDEDWDNDRPIEPIHSLMKKCVGCLVVLLERYYVPEGKIKRGSDSGEKTLTDTAFCTPWNQIEATLAYMEDLPMLILKDRNVYADGVFTGGIKKFRQVKIDITNFREWEGDDKDYIFDAFVEKLKKKSSQKKD